MAEHRDSPVALAIIHAALGNNDGAFMALEQVAARQPHLIARLLIIPKWRYSTAIPDSPSCARVLDWLQALA